MSAPTAPAGRLNYKRLVVASDGTWQTPDTPLTTNILKLAEAVLQEDADGCQQIVFYQAGLGSDGGLNAFLGGGIGDGIDASIKDLYSFLALNYDDGDEIYLFGFSRGAYTVRSLAGLMHNAGLVRRDKLTQITTAYAMYRDREAVNAPGSTKAKDFRRENCMRNGIDRVPITLLACFDTVSALGLPFASINPLISRFNPAHYLFHDTKVSSRVRNAIHCLSIDETRKMFAPTLMTANPKAGDNQLTQLYLPGTHSGVGGGSPGEENLSRFALDWMISEMRRRGLGLEINSSLFTIDSTVDVPPPGDGNEGIVMKAFGAINRALGTYTRDIKSTEQCHILGVATRYQRQPTWRPKSLDPIRKDIMEQDC